MFSADILIVYNRNIQTDKHYCQLIYSITCIPIVKAIRQHRNDDFTIYFYLSNLSFKFQDLIQYSFVRRTKALLVLTCKMIYSGFCRKIGFILSCMSLSLVLKKLFTLTLGFLDSRHGFNNLRQLNHQQCIQYPLAMDILHYCQMSHYH